MSIGINAVLRLAKFSNYRLFRGEEEGLSLSFHENLTVIIGENGAGKTALLEGLLPLLEILIARIKPKGEIDIDKLVSVSDINNEAMVSFTNSVNVGLIPSPDMMKNEILKGLWDDMKTRYNGTTELSEEKQNEISVDWYVSYGKDFEIEADSSNGHTMEVLRTTFGWVGNLIKENNLGGRNTLKHETELPVIVYYPCEKTDNDDWSKIDRKEGRNVRETEYDAYEDALTKQSFNFQRFFRWFKGRENYARQSPDYKHLDIIKGAIYSMLNDDENEGKFFNLQTSYQGYPEDGELEISKRGENAPIKVSQMSSGEKSLFALVADLARRMCVLNPHLPDPLKSHGIVLIDEIDLHLHPRWQQKVIPQLHKTFPNIQFVITTHSPLAITHLDASKSKVGQLKQGAGGSYLVHWIEHYEGWSLEEFLYEYYGIKNRPPKMLEEIDTLFDLIDREQKTEAKVKLESLKRLLGERDTAILDAELLLQSI